MANDDLISVICINRRSEALNLSLIFSRERIVGSHKAGLCSKDIEVYFGTKYPDLGSKGPSEADKEEARKVATAVFENKDFELSKETIREAKIELKLVSGFGGRHIQALLTFKTPADEVKVTFDSKQANFLDVTTGARELQCLVNSLVELIPDRFYDRNGNLIALGFQRNYEIRRFVNLFKTVIGPKLAAQFKGVYQLEEVKGEREFYGQKRQILTGFLVNTRSGMFSLKKVIEISYIENDPHWDINCLDSAYSLHADLIKSEISQMG
jgi:hypothetical protein